LARVLIVHYRPLGSERLATHDHNLYSLSRYSNHACFYLNVARPKAPAYLASLDPDLVLFHHTLLSMREFPELLDALLERVDFVKTLSCPKALVAQDEQVRMDLACKFIRDYEIGLVFSPVDPSLWPRVYRDVDFDAVRFVSVLNGYVDDAVVRRTARLSRNLSHRPIDVGYRTWYTQPFYGRHGQLKQRIGREFEERAPKLGLVTDISNRREDALWGHDWLDFLLKCKYTIGVEGGCSVFDWDGEIARRTTEYVRGHEGATFEEIEEACFPGLDGQFECFTLGSRHLEAAVTRTCQVLLEGEYAGVLEPGRHYIELKRDFSNIDDALSLMKKDELRAGMVERTYEDIVLSGRYSYRAYAKLVFDESLRGLPQPRRVPRLRPLSLALARNGIEEFVVPRLHTISQRSGTAVRSGARRSLSAVLGEARLRSLIAWVRRSRV
jgi:hypothetical protein